MIIIIVFLILIIFSFILFNFVLINNNKSNSIELNYGFNTDIRNIMNNLTIKKISNNKVYYAKTIRIKNFYVFYFNSKDEIKINYNNNLFKINLINKCKNTKYFMSIKINNLYLKKNKIKKYTILNFNSFSLKFLNNIKYNIKHNKNTSHINIVLLSSIFISYDKYKNKIDNSIVNYDNNYTNINLYKIYKKSKIYNKINLNKLIANENTFLKNDIYKKFINFYSSVPTVDFSDFSSGELLDLSKRINPIILLKYILINYFGLELNKNYFKILYSKYNNSFELIIKNNKYVVIKKNKNIIVNYKNKNYVNINKFLI